MVLSLLSDAIPGTVTVRHGMFCVPVLPNQLQFPPDEGVESAEGGDGDEQRDEEGADHVVAEEVAPRVGRRHRHHDLVPVGGEEGYTGHWLKVANDKFSQIHPFH